MKFGRNVCLNEISDVFESGHVGSETRSLCQFFEKLCERPIGLNFSPIPMKLGQTSYEILDKFENGSCQVKN